MRFAFVFAVLSLATGLPAVAQPSAPPPLVQAVPSRVAGSPAPRLQAPAAGWRHEAAFEPAGPTVRDETFTSQSLGRQMKYRIVLPAGYDASARRYPVLYLLHGLTGGYLDWETKTRLVHHLRDYDLIVVMPDAGNSWYTNSAGDAADRYEDYVAKDLVQEVDNRFRSVNSRHARAIAGLSMGGYGALKLGLKYPATYAFAAGFSSAVNMPRRLDSNGNGNGKPSPLQESMLKIYGPPGGPGRAANDVMALAAKADPDRMPYFYLDCGTEDGLLQGNRDFVAVLQRQKIAYEYRELPGAHNFTYWDQQLPEMLHVLAAHVDVRDRF